METFSALLALCAGNSPVTGDSPHKDQWRWALMFSLICTWAKKLSKQWRRRWFETPSRSLWRHSNGVCTGWQSFRRETKRPGRMTWGLCSTDSSISWWRHQMETFSALLAICARNSPVPGEFPAQGPVTRSFDVFCDLHLNKRLSKQSWGWWFETLLCPLWRHCNVYMILFLFLMQIY